MSNISNQIISNAKKALQTSVKLVSKTHHETHEIFTDLEIFLIRIGLDVTFMLSIN